MKIFRQLAYSTLIISVLGTLAYLQASPRCHATPAASLVAVTLPAAPLNELATPLLQKDFTSICLSDKSGHYRETLRFTADASTTFARQYFADAQCQVSNQKKSLRKGRFTVAAEEAGQLLLIVRNLQDEKAADVTPYFEALIKVDHAQLTLQSSLATTLQYAASAPSI